MFVEIEKNYVWKSSLIHIPFMFSNLIPFAWQVQITIVIHIQSVILCPLEVTNIFIVAK